MAEIKGAVSALCVLVLCCCALNALLPQGAVRAYAGFVFSLLSMLALLQPLLALLQWMMEKLP